MARASTSTEEHPSDDIDTSLHQETRGTFLDISGFLDVMSHDDSRLHAKATKLSSTLTSLEASWPCSRLPYEWPGSGMHT